MSLSAPAPEPRRDAKAGYCGMCRQGTHALCRSDICTCHEVVHLSRPKPKPKPRPVAGPPAAAAEPLAVQDPAPAPCGYCLGGNHKRCRSAACGCTKGHHPNRLEAGASKPKAARTVPVFELVREDPPAPPPKPPKPPKLTPAQQVQPLLEAIVEAGEQSSWHRIVRCGHITGTHRIARVLAGEFTEWDFKGAVDQAGHPAIFVRLRDQTAAES